MPTPSKISVISKKQIGNRLRLLRQTRGITQVQLAKMLGTQQTAISQVELGNRGLTIQQVAKLAKALRVSTDAILGHHGNGRESSLPKDRRVLRRMLQIEKLPKAEKRALLKTIDTFLKGSQVS